MAEVLQPIVQQERISECRLDWARAGNVPRESQNAAQNLEERNHTVSFVFL